MCDYNSDCRLLQIIKEVSYFKVGKTRCTMIEPPEENYKFHLLPKLMVLSGILDAERHERFLKTVRIISTFLVHFSVFEFFLMVAVSSKDDLFSWKPNASYLISTLATLVSWHCLRSQRRNLIPLLEKQTKLMKPAGSKKISVSILVVCSVIFAFPFAQTFTTEESYFNSYFTFFSLGFEFGNHAVKAAYILIQFLVVSSCILFFNFNCLIAYVAMCVCSSSLLKEFKNNLLVNSDFGSPQKRLVKKYRTILEFTTDVQFVFSKASFYLCVSYITSDFGAIATFFLVKPDYIGRSLILEHAFMTTLNTNLLFALFYQAGEIPIAMSEVKSAFFKKHAEYAPLLNSADEQAKLYVLNRMMDMPEVVLSGCDIIHYRKTTILLVMGCFITYGLLLIRFQ